MHQLAYRFDHDVRLLDRHGMPAPVGDLQVLGHRSW